MKRILLVYDVDGWAWHGLARGIQEHAPAEFEVTITSEKRCPRSRRALASFDAVLWFSWTCCPLRIKPACRRLWTVIDHHGGTYDCNPDARWTPDVAATPERNLQKARERLPQFSGVIAKNPVLLEFTRELNERTVYLPAGVDVDHWRTAPVSQEPPLRVAWCGQSDPDNPWHSTKGYVQVFLPLVERLKGRPEIVFRTNTATHRNGALAAGDMVRWYQGADVFLCTSSTEGAPLPVFEAAACGRPVVSTAVGAVPELVSDGQTGFLLGTFRNEPEARAVVDRAQRRLLQLAADRPLLGEMSRAIRRKIETSFNWKHLARDWLDALLTAPEQGAVCSGWWPGTWLRAANATAEPLGLSPRVPGRRGKPGGSQQVGAPPLRILCLFPHFCWTRKMSPVRRHSIEAIARRDDVELVLSGPGWPDYDVSRPVRENFEHLMPDADLVLWYKPLGTKEVPALVRPRELNVPACLRFNEAWWPRRQAMKEAIGSGTELVICHHANDMRQFRPFRAWQPVVHHIPHCVERSIFAPAAQPQPQRPIPVLLTGKIHKRTYPLRHRLQRLIRSGRVPGEVRVHPSYDMETEAEALAQVQAYADHLGRAKIVVVDSSRYGYPLSKYTEAAMAGALVLGDVPESPPPGFADFVVPIDRRASDRKIVETVSRWLENEPLRSQRAERGRQIVLARYTQEHYAAAWVNAVCEFLGRAQPLSAPGDSRQVA